jgi:hypothetical protein
MKIVTRIEKLIETGHFKIQKKKNAMKWNEMKWNEMIQCLKNFYYSCKWFVAIHWVNCDSLGNENGPFVTQGIYIV